MTEYSLPGFTTSQSDDGITMLHSETTGMTVRISLDSDGDTEFKATLPAFAGHDEATLETDDFIDIEEFYGEQWIRWAAVTIGLGFHPDTSADNYIEGSLSPALMAEYDEMIGRAHQWCADPYEVSLDAWDKAGLIPPDMSA